MHPEMKHLCDALTDNWGKLGSLIKIATTMCVVTLMKNGIWKPFDRDFPLLKWDTGWKKWSRILFCDIKKLWLGFEILRSELHTLPGISWTKSNFVGWTLKWAKMGSACNFRKTHTQIQFSETPLMAGDSTADAFLSETFLFVCLCHIQRQPWCSQRGEAVPAGLAFISERAGMDPLPCGAQGPPSPLPAQGRRWPCWCLSSAPRTLRQHRKVAPRGPSLWLCSPGALPSTIPFQVHWKVLVLIMS